MKTSLLSTLLFSLLFILPTSTFSQYQINGSALSLSCNCYQLTANAGNLSGSVWNTNSINLTQPFDFNFEIFLGCNDGGADGIVFGLQPIGTGVGSSGGGMGFQGVSPSVGFYIDTYQNGASFDPAADHFSINSNGVIEHDGGVNDLAGPASLPFNIEDCAWHTLRITWDPTTFTFQGYIDGVLYVSYSGDVVTNIFSGNPNVFWGLTGATGGATNLQQFCTELSTDWATDLPDYTCLGQPMQFSDSTSSFGQIVDWNWNFGDGNTSTLQNPSHLYQADAIYNVTLTVTDASGCQDSITESVTVATPSLAPTASPASICSTENSQLNAGLSHPFASQFNYSWTPTTTLSDPSISNPTAAPPSTTMYYISVVDPSTGCSAEDSVLLQVHPYPLVDGPLPAIVACDSFVLSPILGTDLTGNEAYYTGGSGSGTQYNIGDTYTTLGTNTLYAFDSFGGCSSSSAFYITIVPSPTIDLGADVSICPEGTTVLDATTAGVSYVWSDNSTGATLTVSAAGTYWVEITENGCSNSDTIEVFVLPSPTFTLGNDTLVCDPPFEISPSEAYTTYLWQDGSTNATFTVSQPGTYNVAITDADGCVGSSEIVVGNGCQPEIFVPNVFTPNDDQVNDEFFVNASNVENFTLIVLNRWGQVMCELNSPTEVWDGTSPEGNEAKEGVYFWKLNYSYVEDTVQVNEEKSGNVTLIRE